MRLLQLPIGLILLFSLHSCHNIYFENPQPVNSESLYEFPEELRGVWVENGDTLIIDNKQFKTIEFSKSIISKNEVDTSSAYTLIDQKIHLLKKEPVENYLYQLKNDTITFFKRNEDIWTLNDSNLLRPVKHYYILNVKDDNGYWYMGMFKKTKKNTIEFRINSGKYNVEILESILNVKSELLDDNIHLFRSDITQKNMLKYIKNGGFSDTVFILTPEMEVDK